MSDINLNYQIAKRALSLIANQAKQGYLDVIGLSIEDFKLVTGETPWLPEQRHRVATALNTLLSGILVSCGMPLFPLPAEYVAAVIGHYVSPINIMPACSIVERPAPVSKLMIGANDPERCTAHQLFALIVGFHGSAEWEQARQQFERNTRLKLDTLTEQAKQKGG